MGAQKVIVTGNEGYIGSVLTALLGRKGYDVVGWDSGIFRDVEFVPRQLKPQYQIYRDIRDARRSDLDGIDVIIHLAGLSNDPLGQIDPALTSDINYRATVRLAQLAKAAGVKKFLFSSSCSMYGGSGQRLVDEKADFAPQTAYAKSKVEAEVALSSLADDDFSPIFLRNATVFGISPRMRMDLVVQNLVAHGYLAGIIKLLSDGTPWRPLVHVEDVAEAFCFLLTLPRETVHNQAYNVGRSDGNLQIRQIAEMVQLVVAGAQISIGVNRDADQRSYRVDFSKINALGWQPRWTVRQGVEQIYETFRRVGFSQADFESDKYITLRRYEKLMADGRLDKSLRVVGLAQHQTKV